MTMRLSIISFAGIVRTLVAVGTVRLASMFVASDLAMPRRGETTFSASGVGCSPGVVGFALALSGTWAGIGFAAGSTEVVRAAAKVAGGGGGGRDTMAQAGGGDPDKLPDALAAARLEIERALS